MFPVPSDVSEFRVAETATGPSIEEKRVFVKLFLQSDIYG